MVAGKRYWHFAAVVAISAMAMVFGQLSLWFFIWANFLIMALLNYRFFKIALLTLPRDIKGIITLLKVQYNLRRNLRRNVTVGDLFEKYVRKFGDNKEALIDADLGRTWTFNETDEFANQIANYFASNGYRKGDVVSLFMHNCPEYVCVWLGLSKLGVVVALINYNLRADPLRHSLDLAKAKSVIVGVDLLPALAEVDTVADGHRPTIYAYGASETMCSRSLVNSLTLKDLAQELSTVSKSAPIVDDRPGFKDTLFYIYTSGTTGLPKAAIITHCRFCMMGSGAHFSFGIRSSDRVYITMPLYHSAAGILGAAQTLLHGTTCVIRKKFSASKFWDDCIQFDCTASQYIGEICRYLLAQRNKDTDQQHRVRLMYGNGLRPQIWQQFVTRFGIKQIGEFYGSTEGNASLLNLDNQVGAVGFLPIYPFIRAVYPVCLLKVDPETCEVIRNGKGLCVFCRPGESGEIVGRIVKGDPVKDFTGYVSGKDTNKKVIRDVFVHGDSAFASGDILYMDERGYLYFRDRTGDTFRWKGENVSTTEVEAVLHKAVGMNDATVYGVEIPNLEGKAGMAAIADENENIDLVHLQNVLEDKLPAYARPVFLRLCKEVDRTGTYKFKKTDLQKAGFNPRQVNGDRLFYLNNKTGRYEHLSPDVYDAISRGIVSF